MNGDSEIILHIPSASDFPLTSTPAPPAGDIPLANLSAFLPGSTPHIDKLLSLFVGLPSTLVLQASDEFGQARNPALGEVTKGFLVGFTGHFSHVRGGSPKTPPITSILAFQAPSLASMNAAKS